MEYSGIPKNNENKDGFETIRAAFNQAVEMRHEPVGGHSRNKQGRNKMENQNKSSFTGMFTVTTVAGAAVVAAGAYLLWRNRDRVISAVKDAGDAIQHSAIGEKLLADGEGAIKRKLGMPIANKPDFEKKPEKTAH